MREEIFHKVLQYMEKAPAQEAFDTMSAKFPDKDIFLVIVSSDSRFCPTHFFGPPKDFRLIIAEEETWYWTDKAIEAAACYGNMLSNYPISHTMKDGGTLCQECLSDHAKEVMEATDGNNPQWEWVQCDANFEDTDLYCDHCNKRIPSAYCDDDEEEE